MARRKKEEVIEMKLTDVEALKLDLINAELKVRELEVKLSAAEVVILEKDYRIYDLEKSKAEHVIRETRKTVKALQEKITVVQDERRKQLLGISERLGIQGNWGYNPDTLEVHTGA